MRVLVACEFSGIVRDSFAKRGHDAWSCDLLPTESPGNHIQGDVLEILDDGWDLMIAHPPCTHLCVPGAHYLHKEKNRWIAMEKAKEFFMVLFNADIPKICVENPAPHKYAKLPKYTQIIHPYYFGDEFTKRTCLWLVNLQPLIHHNGDDLFSKNTHVKKSERYYRKDGSVSNSKWYAKATAKERSRTFPGIANAMAEQWG